MQSSMTENYTAQPTFSWYPPTLFGVNMKLTPVEKAWRAEKYRTKVYEHLETDRGITANWIHDKANMQRDIVIKALDFLIANKYVKKVKYQANNNKMGYLYIKTAKQYISKTKDEIAKEFGVDVNFKEYIVPLKPEIEMNGHARVIRLLDNPLPKPANSGYSRKIEFGIGSSFNFI